MLAKLGRGQCGQQWRVEADRRTNLRWVARTEIEQGLQAQVARQGEPGADVTDLTGWDIVLE